MLKGYVVRERMGTLALDSHLYSNNTIIFLLRSIRMAILLFIEVLQCLVILRCCELFASGSLNVK